MQRERTPQHSGSVALRRAQVRDDVEREARVDEVVEVRNVRPGRLQVVRPEIPHLLGDTTGTGRQGGPRSPSHRATRYPCARTHARTHVSEQARRSGSNATGKRMGPPRHGSSGGVVRRRWG